MKKSVLIILCCILLLTGCSGKYQRIRLDDEFTQGDIRRYLSDDTVVKIKAEETFPAQLPIYRISPRVITQSDYQNMLQQLQIKEDPSDPYDQFELEGNNVFCNLASFSDHSRGYFDMSDEDLEKLAWETFRKIPFMEGSYEYLGIRSTSTLSDIDGTYITRVGVAFQRLLDGFRVAGDEQCMLYFDGSGLVAIHIELFQYQKIGTMDMVTLEEATTRIKTPDGFTIDVPHTGKANIAHTLQVHQIQLLLSNQYDRGCTILQPLYNFTGTASFTDGCQGDFSSRIIAIPESYTYRQEENDRYPGS